MARAMSALAYCIAVSAEEISSPEDIVFAILISILVRLMDARTEMMMRKMPMTANGTLALWFFNIHRIPQLSKKFHYHRFSSAVYIPHKINHFFTKSSRR